MDPWMAVIETETSEQMVLLSHKTKSRVSVAVYLGVQEQGQRRKYGSSKLDQIYSNYS